MEFGFYRQKANHSWSLVTDAERSLTTAKQAPVVVSLGGHSIHCKKHKILSQQPFQMCAWQTSFFAEKF